MNFDLNKLKEFLESNKYVAYRILSTLDDRTLIQYERYLKLNEQDLNAIYHLKFEKLPLEDKYAQQVTYFQQTTRTEWKKIYQIINLVIGGHHQKLLENDDILPLQVAKLIGEHLYTDGKCIQSRYRDDMNICSNINNTLFRYGKEKIIDYLISNNMIQLGYNYLEKVVEFGSLNWFKKIFKYYQERNHTLNNYSSLIYYAAIHNHNDILKYIVEDLDQIPDAYHMTFILWLNPEVYKYLRSYGAPPYDEQLWLDEISETLPSEIN